jgi:hypothetical protein
MTKKIEKIVQAIEEFEEFIATHPYFPRRGPVCHINSCKALEFFRKHKVQAKLVHFNPKRLKEVTYAGVAPNHVWVEVIGIGYYDAHSQRGYSYDNHPYGDSQLFEAPECDKLSQIFPKHFIKAWERKAGEPIDYPDEKEHMELANQLRAETRLYWQQGGFKKDNDLKVVK